MKVLVTFIIISILFFVTKEVNSIDDQQTYPYKLIVQDVIGGPENPQILVIKEPSLLQEFYAKINMTRKPGLAVPKVNFKKETIIILCMGLKKTAGYQSKINTIEEQEDTIIVYVEEITPAKDDFVPTVITQPFSVYKIPKKNKKIVFRKKNN
ncbi:protease complex subunit PrcB family protein [Leptobacterium sp. I13]|uniref:protease complex subunit PrcB family protein n=1 Tax=Leptobacterium meishanense TaxID=3128904 RepID=UPI0030EF6C02